MGTILVTGGTGTLGGHAVMLLRERGHEVRVLSRRAGAGTHRGDLAAGLGLAAALSGVDLVLHAASDTRRLGRADADQTRNLLVEARRAGVRHLLYVSIVGINAIPFGYYRRKLACERAVECSPVPYTIARATQFHELIAGALRGAERLPAAPLPLDFRFQPVAAPEAARRFADLLEAGPADRAPDFGGPEVLTLAEMFEVWRARRGRPRAAVRLPVPGAVGRAFRAGLNTAPEHAEGIQRWADYVSTLPSE